MTKTTYDEKSKSAATRLGTYFVLIFIALLDQLFDWNTQWVRFFIFMFLFTVAELLYYARRKTN